MSYHEGDSQHAQKIQINNVIHENEKCVFSFFLFLFKYSCLHFHPTMLPHSHKDLAATRKDSEITSQLFRPNYPTQMLANWNDHFVLIN